MAPEGPATITNRENEKRLDSWKEIAAYLKRDVTTVRRWERQEGLPVHRHRHTALGSVYAFTGEIDAWQSGRRRAAAPPDPPAETHRPVVGRDVELRRLHTHFEHAIAGTRRTVFIAGELGLGKTALARTFLDAVGPEVWVAVGQCVEQYSAAEPYLPIIDGLGRLCRDSRNADAGRLVEEHAPSWVDQIPLPWRGRPRRQAERRPGHERMSGELTDAVEALAAVKPLVLLLEDLHWSDHSTVELIARLSRRPDPARLLLIGTYRSAELFDSGSPLLRVCRELRAHFQADEIELSPLTEGAVVELISRDKTWTDARATAARLKQWSGNPLFLVHFLEHLEGSGRLVERHGEWSLDPAPLKGVPGTLRTLLEEQVDRMGAEHRRLLELASVVGEVFPSALVAHVAGPDVIALERSFDDLCRRSHLLIRQPPATWPDGHGSASYGFAHEFYRQVLYDRLPSATVADFHRRIGERLELAYRDRTAEISSELAMHFDRGHDFERAVRYYGIAADNARTRSADREAQIGLSKAAELLARLPPDDRRERMERDLRRRLAATLRGSAAGAPWMDASNYDESTGLVDSLVELSRFHSVSGDLRAALEIGDRAVLVARQTQVSFLDASAQQACVRLIVGEFESARLLALEAVTVADRDGVPPSHPESMRCAAIVAWSAWYQGRYDEARHALDRLLSIADERWSVSIAALAAPLLDLFGDTDRALALVDAGREPEGSRRVSGAWPADAARGRLLARRDPDGLTILRESEQRSRLMEMNAWLPPTLAWMAEGLCAAGRMEDARAAAEDGLTLVRRTGARGFDAELHRLRGDALTGSARSAPGATTTSRERDAAEASYWAGITVARQQDARTLELQTTLSLSRLLVEAGRQEEAGRILRPVCEAFPANVDTPVLAQARALLRE